MNLITKTNENPNKNSQITDKIQIFIKDVKSRPDEIQE